jgi:hypothetical protein
VVSATSNGGTVVKGDNMIPSAEHDGHNAPVEQGLKEASVHIPRVESSPLPQENEERHDVPQALLGTASTVDNRVEVLSGDESHPTEDASKAPEQVVGNDIEDIVNLLEFTPRRSVLVPDAEDVTEIPDED